MYLYDRKVQYTKNIESVKVDKHQMNEIIGAKCTWLWVISSWTTIENFNLWLKANGLFFLIRMTEAEKWFQIAWNTTLSLDYLGCCDSDVDNPWLIYCVRGQGRSTPPLWIALCHVHYVVSYAMDGTGPLQRPTEHPKVQSPPLDDDSGMRLQLPGGCFWLLLHAATKSRNSS